MVPRSVAEGAARDYRHDPFATLALAGERVALLGNFVFRDRALPARPGFLRIEGWSRPRPFHPARRGHGILPTRGDTGCTHQYFVLGALPAKHGDAGACHCTPGE